VLLLVHEDGVAAYYAARSFLRSLGNETGYELMTHDLKLAMPPLDADAAEACREAVLNTLQQRRALLAEMQRRGIENETAFPTGRFEVDPREHDPTREKDSIWSANRSNETRNRSYDMPPQARPRANVAQAGTGSPRAPAFPPMTPLDAAGVSADSIARQTSAAARERRLEDESRYVAEGDQLLREAMAESWPSLGDQKGGKRAWGLSSPTANISLERPVALAVTSRHVTVGAQAPIEVGPAGFTAETARDIVEAVRREADAWGRAPGDFYWTPRLDASLYPGTTLQFERIKRELNDMGLRVSTRIVLEPAAPDFLELTHVTSAPR
jgi:hypothetical protein